MITDNEKFIEIQGILAFSDIHPADCIKINNLIIELSKENQELKEKLDKYENPEDMTLFAMWCTEKVKDENEKLKRQYEKVLNDYCRLDAYHKTQQKEFIKWLEDESKEIYRDGGLRQNIYKEILQKYREVIGDKK